MEFKDKLKSIGFLSRQGTTQIVPVVNEETGKAAGYHEQHWDGRQDATVVQRDPIRVKARFVEED
jgi:hypothetical protein